MQGGATFPRPREFGRQFGSPEIPELTPANATRRIAPALAMIVHDRVPRPAPIPVVCAVIEDGTGRILIAQRPPHKHLGLKWEFAGGKVEPGEPPETAIVREIGEELRCRIQVRHALPRFAHDYGSVAIEMIPFVCTLAPGSPAPHPHEHVAVRWVTLGELSSIDLAAADWPVVAAYRAMVAGGR